LTDDLFDGLGGCLTKSSATIGLILAIREAAELFTDRKYALMPSFTFAATAHAAIWAGLTPLFCDIDRDTWAMCPRSVKQILETYGDRVACVIPYAPFGNCIDLDFYERLTSKYNIGMVVDAAASLGSLDYSGHNFGAGFSNP